MGLRGTPSTARALNRRLVLDQLRRNGPMSRAAISTAIGLSPAAITFVTADLIGEGLLIEGKAVSGAAGRRPVPLEIDYASRLSIGLKVTVDHIVGVVSNLATRVIAGIEVPLVDHRPETVVGACVGATEGLLRKAGLRRTDLIGIGVVLSGQVDAEAGNCRRVQRFGWRDVPIAAMLADVVSVPVWIDNDANAFAVSQHLFGHGRGMNNIAAIAIGKGVGAGLVIGGTVYRGAGGAAGEFGHNFEERGRRCECGSDGCLETYCSDPGLLRTWRESDPTVGDRTVEHLADAVSAGDVIARKVVAEAGTRLGRHVAALINVLNPEMIVFGGEGIRFSDWLFDPMRTVLEDVCFPGSPRMAIDLDGTEWPRGAAALAIQHFFNFEATGGHRSKPSNQSDKSLRLRVA